MAPEEEVIRGGQARDVLESRIFVEAKCKILDGIHAQMRAVPISDDKMHTRLILTLQLWDTLEKYLENVKQTGELASFQLQQEEDRKKRLRIFG